MTSSRTRQCEWANFAVALQPYTIVDHGGKIRRKLDVFCELYDPRSTTQLDLVVSNHHPLLSLVPRGDFDASLAHQSELDNATDTVIRRMAMDIMTKNGTDLTAITVLGMITAGMRQVYDNCAQIEDQVNKVLQGK